MQATETRHFITEDYAVRAAFRVRRYQLRLTVEPRYYGGMYSLALADHCAVFEVIRLEAEHPIRILEGALIG